MAAKRRGSSPLPKVGKRHASDRLSESSTSSSAAVFEYPDDDIESETVGSISSSSLSTRTSSHEHRSAVHAPTSDRIRANESVITTTNLTRGPSTSSSSPDFECNNKDATMSNSASVVAPKIARMDVNELARLQSQELSKCHTTSKSPPDQRRSGQTTKSTSLVPFIPPDAFPYYRTGDVVITLDPSCPSTTLKLHSSVLARCSAWFESELRLNNLNGSDPTCSSFQLDEVDGSMRLVRQHVHGKKSDLLVQNYNGAQPEDRTTEDNSIRRVPSVKERLPFTQTSPVSRRPRLSEFIINYTQILGTFYNIPPKVCTTAIATALDECESLITIASQLSAVPLLRPHLGTVFSQYRQTLFTAIKSDPPRWIGLALALENTAIYTECLIHLTGAHPHWPWPTKNRDTLPRETHELIATKSKELDNLCVDIDRDLLMMTIEVGRQGRPVSSDPGELETWLVVQMYRDNIANGLRSLDKRGKKSLQRGHLYRRIRRGGSEYLEYEEVRDQCLGIMRGEWKDLGDDLKVLKVYATGIVEEVAENRLMIEPDGNGIGYLTCARIGPEDVPWLRGP